MSNSSTYEQQSDLGPGDPTTDKETKRQVWQYKPDGVSANSTLNNANIYYRQTSEKSRQLLADIERVARRPYNILVTGETGTGKTLAARQIHQKSSRANKPFMELNCANLPEHLVEAELFGYRKGAFTGADRDHKGLFEEADGGILFLDEIGDVPPAVQNKLLKAIDEKKIKRLGTNRYIECDVQIISATSRNLTEMIKAREFRIDLYCRLAVLTIEVAPLRARREDIPAMIDYYLRESAQTVTGNKEQDISFKIEQGAVELLLEYDYSGNIRELKNLIYELTSFVHLNETITLELAQATLAKLQPGGCYNMAVTDNIQSQKEKSFLGQTVSGINSAEVEADTPGTSSIHISKGNRCPVIQSIEAGDGDIILPAEVCVIRKGETLKQWAARAKRISLETTQKAMGGKLSTAQRLGLTLESLKGHIHRARLRSPGSNTCEDNS